MTDWKETLQHCPLFPILPPTLTPFRCSYGKGLFSAWMATQYPIFSAPTYENAWNSNRFHGIFTAIHFCIHRSKSIDIESIGNWMPRRTKMCWWNKPTSLLRQHFAIKLINSLARHMRLKTNWPCHYIVDTMNIQWVLMTKVQDLAINWVSQVASRNL